MTVVVPFLPEHQAGVIDVILPIQQLEFGIPITLEDQPDLRDVPGFYQHGSGNFWVALSGTQVVGTIALLDIGSAQGALRKMFVRPEYRGPDRQVARRLFETLIGWCREKNIRQVFLGTTAKFVAAHRFYEKWGFEEIPKADLPAAFPVMSVDTKFYVRVIPTGDSHPSVPADGPLSGSIWRRGSVSMDVREAIPGDSARLIPLFGRLYSETHFLLFEPDEFTVTEEQQARRIEEMSRSHSGAMFVCESNAELIGVIFGNRGIARRTRHSLYVVIGVLQAWVGRGVGRALMEALEGWARSRGLHRLELTVDADNRQAIALYEKCGFEREGVKRHSRKIGESYSDELCMSKLIAG